MIFVLDIGNTNTVLGVFKNDELTYEWRIQTNRHRTEDELAVLVKSLFDLHDIEISDVLAVVVSSVVPPIMYAVEKMCHKYFGLTPLIVGKDDVTTYLDIVYPQPKEIGADRIVNAVGAIHLYTPPFIIIDFGTATTFCYIDRNGAYHGGLITPGVKISMDALYHHASKLPKIEIEKPNNIIGQSTVEAMQSGVFYGYVSQVDGIVERMKEEVGEDPTVIATGGFATLIARESKTIEKIETHLTLKGLYTIYKLIKDESE